MRHHTCKVREKNVTCEVYSSHDSGESTRLGIQKKSKKNDVKTLRVEFLVATWTEGSCARKVWDVKVKGLSTRLAATLASLRRVNVQQSAGLIPSHLPERCPSGPHQHIASPGSSLTFSCTGLQARPRDVSVGLTAWVSSSHKLILGSTLSSPSVSSRSTDVAKTPSFPRNHATRNLTQDTECLKRFPGRVLGGGLLWPRSLPELFWERAKQARSIPDAHHLCQGSLASSVSCLTDRNASVLSLYMDATQYPATRDLTPALRD